MSLPALLGRLAAMSGDERRVRLATAKRNAAARLAFAIRRPRWDRRELTRLLDPAAGPLVAAARDAAARGDFLEAHRILGRHFATRPRRWPVAAASRQAFAGALHARTPMAGVAAWDAAAGILAGRYDLLGYRALPLGTRPDWHRDAVHERSAPRGFWASVPFLDPASGDHKVIWEINRHQHFLRLGVAWWLTGRTACRDLFIDQLEDWLAHNPPLDGVNWASMLELAFRSLSWTWALEFFCEEPAGDDVPWLVDLLVALDRQLTHVEHNLSTYFSPNTHLTGEALALYAVSQALPELRHSAGRAAAGRAILVREAGVQVHADGGHAELSTHYHRYTTDFYLLALLVARATSDPAASRFEEALRPLATFLRTMADARGRLPNIGDDDGGQLFPFGDSGPADARPTLAAAAALLGEPSLGILPSGNDAFWILGEVPRVPIAPVTPASWTSRALTASGYFVSRRDDRGDHLIFDTGAHGFLNGGHAHADALSVVLTAGHLPLLVDPGTGTYTMDAGVRDTLRASDMHNTAVVDGRPFAVARGPFHWRQITHASLVVSDVSSDVDVAIGRHEGYGFPLLRAVVTFPGHGWLIVDHASAPRDVRLDSWWHLHPSWSASPDEGGFALRHSGGARLALVTTAPERSMEMRPFSPAYGRVQHAIALRTGVTPSRRPVVAAYIPAAALASRPSIALAAVDDESQPGWTTVLVTLSAGTELLVSVTLPVTAAPGREWPRPCIQEVRAICVE
jgi:hypothetical protein